MAELGTVYVDIQANFQNLQKDAKAGFSKLGGIATKAFAGAFLAKQAFDLGAGFVNAAEESGSLIAGIDNLVKQQEQALGPAATLATDALVDQANAIEALTGFSDEQVLAAQRQLLTFQNLQNAGEGAGAAFDRATGALADMVAAGALSDFNSGAIQLGKALNDPIKGLTALSRAGVTFTDQQKDQVAALQESGDLLGAQQIILDELEKVYGGTAEAQRDATAVIGNAWQDIQVRIGTAMLPLLERLATWIVDTVIPAFERWGPAIGKVLGQIGDFVKGLLGGLGAAQGAGQGFFDKFRGWFERLGTIFSKFFELARVLFDAAVAYWTFIWETWGDDIIRMVSTVWNTVSALIDAALQIIEGILDVFIGVFTGDWERAWDGVLSVVDGVWDAIFAVIKNGIILIGQWFRAIPGQIISWLGGAAQMAWDWAVGLVNGLINGLKSMAGKLASAVKDTILAPIRGVGDFLGIGSPSKLFTMYGEGVSQGMAIGIRRRLRDVQAATRELSGITAGGGDFFSPELAGAATGAAPITIVNPIARSLNSDIQRGSAMSRLVAR